MSFKGLEMKLLCRYFNLTAHGRKHGIPFDPPADFEFLNIRYLWYWGRLPSYEEYVAEIEKSRALTAGLEAQGNVSKIVKPDFPKSKLPTEIWSKICEYIIQDLDTFAIKMSDDGISTKCRMPSIAQVNRLLRHEALRLLPFSITFHPFELTYPVCPTEMKYPFANLLNYWWIQNKQMRRNLRSLKVVYGYEDEVTLELEKEDLVVSTSFPDLSLVKPGLETEIKEYLDEWYQDVKSVDRGWKGELLYATVMQNQDVWEKIFLVWKVGYGL